MRRKSRSEYKTVMKNSYGVKCLLCGASISPGKHCQGSHHEFIEFEPLLDENKKQVYDGFGRPVSIEVNREAWR